MDFHWQLGRTIDPRQIDELPAPELGPVAEVRIFGKRIVLPAAGVVDHLAPQHPGCSVEIEEVTGSRSGAVLQNEVPVEKQALHFRQEVKIAIQIAPARLHDSHAGVGKVVDCTGQKIHWRDEIRIEYSYEFTGGRLKAFLQRPGLKSFAISAVEILDRMPDVPVLLTKGLGVLVAVVSRIVKHLNLQKFARVLDFYGLVDEALQHITFVIQRQLDGDAG